MAKHLNAAANEAPDSDSYVEVDCRHWLYYFGFGSPAPDQPAVGSPAPTTTALLHRAQHLYFHLFAPTLYRRQPMARSNATYLLRPFLNKEQADEVR